MTEIINGYELRVAVVDLDLLEKWNKRFNETTEITDTTDDNVFYSIAEEQGNIWSIGYFQKQLNEKEINLNNSVVRFLLCDVKHDEDETRQDIYSVNEMTLYVDIGKITKHEYM